MLGVDKGGYGLAQCDEITKRCAGRDAYDGMEHLTPKNYIYKARATGVSNTKYNDRVIVCMVYTHVARVRIKPGKVANPARGQLNRENVFFPVPVRA